MKRVQIRSLFWSVFFLIRIEYGEILRYLSVFSPIGGKYGPENFVFGHFLRSEQHQQQKKPENKSE